MLLLPFTTVVTRKQHCRSTRMQNEKHEYTWPKFQSLSTRTERAERRQKKKFMQRRSPESGDVNVED